MEISQLFETTVADRNQGYTFRFLTIPQRSFTDAVKHNDPSAKEVLSEILGLQQLQLIQPSLLPQVIVSMIRADEAKVLQKLQAKALIAQMLKTTPLEIEMSRVSPETLAFAEQIAFTNIIPFEESPINLVSLAGQAAKLAKSPIALGAFIGVVASGPTSLILLAVPAGIILCGTAIAFAKTVDANRELIMRKLLGSLLKTEDEVASAVNKPDKKIVKREKKL